ncbi:MAG: ArsR/SmtB family transcription factor [Pikeienuella sp.]
MLTFEQTTPTQLDAIFAALADSTRRDIVARLAGHEMPLSKLAEPLPMSQTAVSKHVGVLAEAGLVRVEKRGRTRFCALQPSPMGQAADWLKFYQRFWENQLESLARSLAEEEGESS